MEKEEWTAQTRSVVEPVLVPGETILAIGEVEIQMVNLWDQLFTGLPDANTKKHVHAIWTSMRAIFVATDVSTGQILIAADGIGWNAISRVVEPKPLLAADAKYLNFEIARDPHRRMTSDQQEPAIRMKIWPDLLGITKSYSTDPHQAMPYFYANAARIAMERFQAAHAAGAQPVTPAIHQTARTARPFPVRKKGKASESSALRPPNKGRALPIVLFIAAMLAAAASWRAFDKRTENLQWAEEERGNVRARLAVALTRPSSSMIDLYDRRAEEWFNYGAGLGAASVVLIAAGIALWIRGSRRATATALAPGAA